MELQVLVQFFINQLSEELGISPSPIVRLIDSPSSSPKFGAGDFRIHMSQPSFNPLKPHIQRVISDLPRISKQWPSPISKVEVKPGCPYLEIYLERSKALRYLCERITELHTRVLTCQTRASVRKRMLVVIGPGQDAFDLKKSLLLVNFMRRAAHLSGFETSLLEELGEQEANCAVEEDEYKSCPYYDDSWKGFNLGKFIEDRELSGKFDSGIGVVYDASPALKYALCLRRNMSEAPEDMICHVVSQKRSVFQQQISLLLMILGCQANQSFLIHGGVDAAGSTVEAYEERIRVDISYQLRQKKVPEAERIGEILRKTKIAFDFLSIKQQSRVKIPSIMQDTEVNCFEGKSGLFVQYTCSRLEALIRKYDGAIMKGVYTECSLSNEIPEESLDWSLLSSEQEWNLWTMASRLIDILESLTETLRGCGSASRIDVKTHSLCDGLLKLSRDFSIFYSKVRILVQSQAHISAMVQCRIYFVGMLLKLIKCGLWLLGLDSVDIM